MCILAQDFMEKKDSLDKEKKLCTYDLPPA